MSIFKELAMDAGGNRYIKMSLVQDYRWRAIW